MSELRVYIHHVRGPGVCAFGIKRWFDRFGLDLTDFLMNGIAVSELEKIDDEWARKAIASARQEAEGDDGRE